MEMRIKKRPSISKIAPGTKQEKMMNMTFSTAILPSSQKQVKLPPIRRNLRKALPKIEQQAPKEQLKKERKETETTQNDSVMFQSYYQTMSKGWVKPSDYLSDIKELNLLEIDQEAPGCSQSLNVGDYEVRLSEKVEKNVERMERLFQLTEKWVGILKRALFYVTSQKSNSDRLIEEVRFWRELSRKFDELEYEFNDHKSQRLIALMTSSLKTMPEHRKLFEEFLGLKQQVIAQTVPIKKLHLSLEEIIAGSAVKFEESSCILESMGLLKKMLLGFSALTDSYPILDNRLDIVFRKMDLNLVQKLLAAPLYPRELANVSGLKFRYQLLDHALSFYSNFISLMEDNSHRYASIIERAEYGRSVVCNLLEILCYFEHLYKKKEVLEFSKLFGHSIDYNIYDMDFASEWAEYMEMVHSSMENKGYEP